MLAKLENKIKSAYESSKSNLVYSKQVAAWSIEQDEVK